MSIEIKDITSCKRNLIVELPAEALDREINELAQKYSQRVRVPGFRPGKVPVSIIKQRFSAELRSDATQDLVQRSWKAAVKEHQLEPLAEPVLEHMDSEPGSPVKFTVSFEVLPPLEIKNYIGVSVEVPSTAIEEADVEKALEVLRDQNSLLVPVEQEPIHDGHVVTIRVEGRFEGGGKPIHEEDVVLVIGDPRTEPAFSENLRGARLGEERSFEVRYPEDYYRKGFAGKLVRYTAIIKEIKEKQLPELNDEFAQDTAGQENLTALRTKIRDELEKKANLDADNKTRETVLDQVVRQHSFDIPECLVNDELEHQSRLIAHRLVKQGIDIKRASLNWGEILDAERPQAEQTVRRKLVLAAIARQEHLEPTAEEVDQEFQKLAEASGKSAAVLRAQFEKDKRIQEFKDRLRSKMALDFIVRNANITRRS